MPERENRFLSENTLVVAVEKGALSLAGLMGGAASAVSDGTQNIVLEVAWFAPEIISRQIAPIRFRFGFVVPLRARRGLLFAGGCH